MDITNCAISKLDSATIQKLTPRQSQDKRSHYRLQNLSTGITLPLNYSIKQRIEAEKKAEKAAEQKVLEYFNMDHPSARKSIPNLSAYLEQYYYPHLHTNRAERTLETYKRPLDYFLKICGDKPLPAYNRSHVHDYKILRFDIDDVRKTTINIDELRSIKAAFSWAYKNDYVERFAFKGQEFLFDARTTKRKFKDFELEKLFKITEGNMIGLAIQLAYYTGMRQGELSHTTWRMVNQKERNIHLPSSIILIPLKKKT